MDTNKKEAKVDLIYHSVNADITYTETVSTKDEKAFTATIIADSLKPGTTYEYQIKIDDQLISNNTDQLKFTTQELWQHRNDPPNWKMALGSCAYINEKEYDRPGEPYGGGYSYLNLSMKSLRILCFG